MPSAKGQLLEARVARLLHAEGAFVRRAVDLNARFREHFQVTDIDVLAFFFDRTLESRVVNGECKGAATKSAPSSADRLLWLTGVAKLIDADRSFLATAKNASANARSLAARLNAEIVDSRDLQRREELVGLDGTSPYGPHALEIATIAATAFKTVKADDELKRIYGFVRSDLWLASPPVALKRALQACRVLGSRYSDQLPEAERTAVKWLASESITGLTLALTRIAARAYRQPEDVFEAYLRERLAEGAANFVAMQEMSKAIDKYLLGILTQLGVDPVKGADALGAFEPKAPPYTEPLLEIVQRLALAASAAVDLARLAEYYLLADLHPEVGSAPVPAADEVETGRLLRLVAAFLERQAGVPASLLESLRSGGAANTEAPKQAGAENAIRSDGTDGQAADAGAHTETPLFRGTGT